MKYGYSTPDGTAFATRREASQHLRLQAIKRAEMALDSYKAMMDAIRTPSYVSPLQKLCLNFWKLDVRPPTKIWT